MNNTTFDKNTKNNSNDLGKDYNGVKEYLADIANLDIPLNSEGSDNVDRNDPQYLVEHNMKLVVSIAKKYSNNSVNMPLEDIIQEGNIGLCNAAQKYNPSKGYAFSTYAVPWIKQGIFRSFTQKGRPIRVPDHMFEKMNKVKKVRDAYFQKYGEYADDEYVAEKLGLSVESVEECDRYTYSIESTDREIDDDNETTFGEMLEDFKVQKPEDAYDDVEIADQLAEALSELTPQERDVLEKRLGFGEGKEYTLEELGNEYQVTRERIRQIQAQAIAKLRKKPYIRDLVYAHFGSLGECI
ncbi:RNA polymerase primary sigma factor [Lachnospiraceae bacterium NE2001]|nr:RNA polymerase primary sigma factor [Lachnospiraceae bacterium NE2001]